MNKRLRTFWCLACAVLLPIIGQAQLNASFTSNITSGCSPIVVQFTNTSTGNPTGYLWNLGNSTTSTLPNPSTTYITPGVYTVRLIVFSGSQSDTQLMVNYINVVPVPTVSFTASDSGVVCPPKTISFNNNSSPNTPGAATYFWDFGDGTSSSLQNPPPHQYTAPGNYTVSLIITNSSGCTKTLTKTNYIQGVVVPTANFTGTNASTCSVPATVNFTNTSTGATSYLWNFGNGSTSTAINPNKLYTVSGTYTVTLIATNAAGCKDTIVMPNFVNIGNLSASFSPSTTNTCTNQSILFNNTSVPGPGNSTWNFGDGTTSTLASPSHAYTAPGTYTVKLVVNFANCSDSATTTITVNSGPTVAFTGSPLTSCTAPLTVNFSNASTGGPGLTYLWRFGDGTTSTAANPSHTYTGTGQFPVTLIVTKTNGCKDSLVKPNYVKIATAVTGQISPVVAQGCAPYTVAFSSNNINSGVPIVSYSWNFGDGTPVSTLPNPTHTFTTPGTFTVTLTVSTGPGCFSTKTRTVNVSGTQPNASFNITPPVVCPNTPVTFNSTSTNTTNVIWYVYPTGGSIAGSTVYYQDSFTVNSGSSGIFDIALVAQNGFCTDTIIQTVALTVSLPGAQYVPVFNCTNRKSVTFTNTSAGGTSYTWKFGDGTTSTQTNPSHLYTNYGNYTVRLIAFSSVTGCTDSITKIIDLYPLTAQFSASDTTICKNTSITFTAVPDTSAVSYTWLYGDGTTGIGQTTNKVYTTAGLYTVKLIVKDIQNCTDTLTKTNYISVGGPTVAFSGTPVTGCAPLPVNFTDASASNGVAITSRFWTFGDGGTLAGNNASPAHTYGAGSFTVKLKVTDASGCTDSLIKPLYINTSRPTAAFTTNDTFVCPGQNVAFFNNSTSSSGGGTLSYAWNFGDGTTSIIASPNKTYALPGNYTVRLIATNANGCKDTLIKTAYIHVGPLQLSFIASDTFATCPPLTVTFTNTSVAVTNFVWTFGNGNSSSLTSPTTTFTVPGTYTVKLKGIKGNCTDSITKTIIVLGPTGTFTYSPTNGCKPLTVNFTATAMNTQAFIWDLNNGVTVNTTVPTLNYTYTSAGVFLPKLLLSDGNSCIVPIIGIDTIKVGEIKGDFTITGNQQCGSGTVLFKDTVLNSVSPVQSISWTFGDGGTSSIHNPTHFYSSPGTYVVKMILTSQLGCKDTVTKNVVIKTKPTVNAGPDQSFCIGQSTSVQLQATGAATYVWSPTATLSCTTCNNPLATPTSNTTYTAIGTLVNGCSDTDQVAVIFNPLPTVTASPNQTICNGAFAQLNATGATTYTWAPTASLSCTTCPNPSASPANTTTYTVTGIDTNGCSDTGQVTVTVSQLPTVSGGPNKTICIGGSTTLNATGATSYTWSPATGLSCTNCANPTANPAVTTTYTVTGSGAAANSCSNTAMVTVTVNPLPTILAGASQTICAGTSVQLLSSGAGAGGMYSWSPATGLSATNIPNPIATPLITTTYTVTGTTAIGCINTATKTITVNPQPVVNAGNDQSICTGTTAQLLATGATTYVWSPAAGLSNPNIPNPVATVIASTTYTVIGTNANNCSDTDDVTITVNPIPVVTAGSNQSICPGTTAQLQAAGAVSYVWTPTTGLSNPNISNPIASPAATTTYTVTGTDANGCTDTGVVTISILPTPNVTGGPAQSICSGLAATLAPTGAVSYVWNANPTLSCTACTNPLASPLATTTYIVTGTNANGCTDTGQVTITVDPLPNISAGGNASICLGASVTLQPTGASTYVWSPATGLSCTACTNPIASPLVTTTYTVTGTSTAGCSGTAQVTVMVNPLPNVTAGNNVSICPGFSTQLMASGATSYSWSPAAGLSATNIANPIASPAATTTYIVTGTDANGCTDTGIVSVIVYPTPNINAGPNQSICIGGSTNLMAQGGTNYQWLPNPTLSCTACANPVATPTVTTTYTVTGLSLDGCVDTGTITITVNPLPIINAGNDATICLGSSTTLQPTGGVSYNWSPATGLTCTACTNPLALPSTTTTYVVTGNNANGCANKDSVTVFVNPLPVVDAGPDQIICQANSVNLQASGAVSYVWSPTTGLSCTTCANPVASPAATTTYTVTGTDANGCTNTDDVTVSTYPQPNISAGADQTICAGDSIMLQATGGVDYVWSPAALLTCSNCPNPVTSPAATTTFSVVATDANGCMDSAQVTINVIMKNIVQVGFGDTICAGESTQLNVSGGDTYLWIPATGLNDPTIASPVATPLVTTNYTIIIQQNQCFADTGNILVVVNPQPTVNAGPDQTILLGDVAYLNPTVTDATTFAWTPAALVNCPTCQNTTTSPTTETTYVILVGNMGGCFATDSLTINVQCDNTLLFLPNTFTPNGDLHNDRFFPQSKGTIHVNRFRIYTRWGELIYDAQNFDTNMPEFGWDGTYKGQQLKPDVFVYIVSATCDNGQKSETKGDISLIR